MSADNGIQTGDFEAKLCSNKPEPTELPHTEDGVKSFVIRLERASSRIHISFVKMTFCGVLRPSLKHVHWGPHRRAPRGCLFGRKSRNS